jgi:hypothetical protein
MNDELYRIRKEAVMTTIKFKSDVFFKVQENKHHKKALESAIVDPQVIQNSHSQSMQA